MRPEAWPLRHRAQQQNAGLANQKLATPAKRPCTWDANLGCVADRAVYLLAIHRLAQRVLAMQVATVVTEIDPAPC